MEKNNEMTRNVLMKLTNRNWTNFYKTWRSLSLREGNTDFYLKNNHSILKKIYILFLFILLQNHIFAQMFILTETPSQASNVPHGCVDTFPAKIIRHACLDNMKGNRGDGFY